MMFDIKKFRKVFLMQNYEECQRILVGCPECLFSNNTIIVEGIHDKRLLKSLVDVYSLGWTVVDSGGSDNIFNDFLEYLGINYICLYDSDVLLDGVHMSLNRNAIRDAVKLNCQNLEIIKQIETKIFQIPVTKSALAYINAGTRTRYRNILLVVFCHIIYIQTGKIPIQSDDSDFGQLAKRLTQLSSKKQIKRIFDLLSIWDIKWTMFCNDYTTSSYLQQYNRELNELGVDLNDGLVVCHIKYMISNEIKRQQSKRDDKNILDEFIENINSLSINNHLYVWPPVKGLVMQIEDIWKILSNNPHFKKDHWKNMSIHHIRKTINEFKNSGQPFNIIENLINRLIVSRFGSILTNKKCQYYMPFLLELVDMLRLLEFQDLYKFCFTCRDYYKQLHNVELLSLILFRNVEDISDPQSLTWLRIFFSDLPTELPKTVLSDINTLLQKHDGFFITTRDFARSIVCTIGRNYRN